MSGLRSLKRIAEPPPKPQPEATTQERCEFCAVDIGERHGHVADINEHRLLCVCRPCYLLFGPAGSGGGRYRGVGEEIRRVADLRIGEAQWDSLRIPVDLAFFFRQTGSAQLLGFYPGPSGATESLLDLSAWDTIVADNPAADTAEPDVEAVLLRRHAGAFTCHLVPIDLCYELVGIVRLSWTGLGGGREVWRAIDNFFSDIESRATPVGHEAAG